MTPRRGVKARGASLLEVALAMAIMAIGVLGLLGTHMALARQGQTASVRERAAFAVDAIAEATIVATTGAAGRWQARVPSIVPQAALALTSAGGGITLATLTWTAVRNAIGAPASCGGAPLEPGRECVALAFAP